MDAKKFIPPFTPARSATTKATARNAKCLAPGRNKMPAKKPQGKMPELRLPDAANAEEGASRPYFLYRQDVQCLNAEEGEAEPILLAMLEFRP